jgi:hypothetical protein
MSSVKSNKFEDFQNTLFGNYYVYVHPLLPFKKIDAKNVKILLLGYIIDPHSPHLQDDEILLYICNNTQTVDDVSELLYPLSGRFALFIEINKQLFVFHDPCGFRTVTYTKTDEGLIFGSDEQIINEIITLKKGEKFAEYENSELKKELENWIFAGVSLYERTYKLIPNHYLKTDALIQIRYFPNKKVIKTDDIESIVKKSIGILVGTFSALKHRNYSLACTVTAGRDTRLLMAFLDNSCEDVFYYTMSYRSVVNNHYDIKVPAKILKELGIHHNIFDCTSSPSVDFLSVYMKNSTMAHEELCAICYGMDKYYPKERLNIKGLSSAIPSWRYSSTLIGFSCYEDFVNKVGYYSQLELSFNEKALKQWFDEAKFFQDNFYISLLDLVYWEQRCGSWAAQGQLEWDIVQETYNPHNNRELLYTMLTLHHNYRKKHDNKLYKKIISNKTPILLKFPYDNEKNLIIKLFKTTKRFTKKSLKSLGINVHLIRKIKKVIKK